MRIDVPWKTKENCGASNGSLTRGTIMQGENRLLLRNTRLHASLTLVNFMIVQLEHKTTYRSPPKYDQLKPITAHDG